MAETQRSMLLPGALAGAVAAATWAAAEPLVARALGTGYTDVRFLGGLVVRRGPSGTTSRSRRGPGGRSGAGQHMAGLAWHVANGAGFGAVFSGLGGRGWKQGLAAAQAENALTWPLLPVVSRRHPDYRSVRWRSPLGVLIFVQEAVVHALFGVVLGALSGDPGGRRAPGAAPGPPRNGKCMPFDFDPRFQPLLRLLGVRPGNAYVEATDGKLRARFGPWSLETGRDNVRSVSVAGPYRWFKAIGARVSMADRGITFGTNTRRGVCIEFHQPVRAFDPLGLVRHPNLTVTVADPEALVSALDHA